MTGQAGGMLAGSSESGLVEVDAEAIVVKTVVVLTVMSASSITNIITCLYTKE